MKPPFIRAPGNYDTDAASDESAIGGKRYPWDVSKTKQSFAEEADINTIVRRFNLTGQLPENVRAPTYGDYEGIFDFQSAMNAVREAEESFAAMPANVRARFNNNPAAFVDYCSELTPDLKDFEHRAELEKLGLVLPRKPSEADKTIAKGDTPPEPPKDAPKDAPKAP